jgi:DNA-binding transcriptional ArsR family regulator
MPDQAPTLRAAQSAARAKRAQSWTFLTNHAVVLLLVDAEPDQRVADVAVAAGLTERAVQMILLDLVEAGYVTRSRSGRRTTYALNRDAPLRRPNVTGRATVGDLLTVFRSQNGERGERQPPRDA